MAFVDILLMVLVAAIWGFNFVVIKVGIANFPPILFSALRFLFAALPLIFFIPRPAVSWRIIISIGMVLGVIKFSLLFIGMDEGVSAGLASLVLQCQAFFTVILAALAFRERPRPIQVVGIVAAFVGVAIIGTTIDASFSFRGLVLILGAAFAWAVSNMLMKKAGGVDMLRLMVWVSLVPPLPLFVISVLSEGLDRDIEALKSLTMSGAAAVIYIAYLATIFGFAVWGRMIRKYSLSNVAPFSLLVPVFGMSSSALIFGESFSLARLAGATLIVCGLVLTVLGPRVFMKRAAVGT